MSREQVENDKYIFAFGVDHTPMGCFFQLWEKAAVGEQPDMDEGDVPQISCDEVYGMKINNLKTLERNPELKMVIIFDFNIRDTTPIIKIGRACGFDVSKEVYKLWD